MALGAWMSGRADWGRDRIDQALTIALNSKSPYELAYARYYESRLYLELREFRRAEAPATQAVTLSGQHDFLYLSAEARVLLGRIRAQLGGAREAVSLTQQGLSERIKNGSKVAITFNLMCLGEVQALHGKYRRGADHPGACARREPRRTRLPPPSFELLRTASLATGAARNCRG
jgi:hypothetical protein